MTARAWAETLVRPSHQSRAGRDRRLSSREEARMFRCPAPVQKVCVLVVLLIPTLQISRAAQLVASPHDGLRFEVVVPAASSGGSQPPARPVSGRLMVEIGRAHV